MTNDVQIDEVSGVVTQPVAVVAAPVTLTGLTVDVLTARQLVEIGDLVTFSYTPSATEGEEGEWRIESVGDVDGDVGDVGGNVGDVEGNVGSVGGDVGEVGGNVGGDVGGDVEGNVGGDVRSVDGSVDYNVGGSVGSVDGDVGDVGGDVGDIGGDCGEVSGSVNGGSNVDSDFWDDLKENVESIQKLIKDNCND